MSDPDLTTTIKPAKKKRGKWYRRWLVLKYGFWLMLVVVLLGMVAIIFWDRMFISVGSGEVMVVYHRFIGGTLNNKISREGFHMIPPWDKYFIYSVRTQTLVQPMTVLSSNGLEVTFDAQIRYHAIPEAVPYLHRRYGPKYAEQIITPQLTQSVQEVIGQFLPEELYSLQRTASADRIFAKGKRLIGGSFIEVEDISLFNIKLPERIQTAIQNKVEEEQKALAYDYRLQAEDKEAQRKLIEAKGIQEYQARVKNNLAWKGIDATLELAKSTNAKVIVIGAKDSLPILLGNVAEPAAK